MSPLLTTRKLTRRFGSLIAVRDVDIAVRDNSIHAIIGPNGAGKTTLFNLITGKLAPSAGSVEFNGEDITGCPVDAIVRKGIGRSFQITNIFPRLTVFENVFIAVLAKNGQTHRLFSVPERFDAEVAEAHRILETVDLAAKGELATSSLSHGEQRNLELGLSLALEPRLLLLDEPTAGMSIEETSSTVDLIKRISADTTVLFTEHDMSIVFSIADTITVLHQGAVIAEGLPDAIRKNREVRAAYLGEDT